MNTGGEKTDTTRIGDEMNTVFGPFQVDEDCIETHGTLDMTDVGCWYIIINGSMQFVKDKETGIKKVSELKRSTNRNGGDRFT